MQGLLSVSRANALEEQLQVLARCPLDARIDRHGLHPDLKIKDMQLHTAGKPVKAAVVAVIRKHIEIANARIKADRKWTPKFA